MRFRLMSDSVTNIFFDEGVIAILLVPLVLSLVVLALFYYMDKIDEHFNDDEKD